MRDTGIPHPYGSGCRAVSFPAASRSDRSPRARGDSRPGAAPSAHKRPRSPPGAVSLRGQQAAERREPEPVGTAHGRADTASAGAQHRVAPPRGEPSAAPCPRCHPDRTAAGEHRVPPASHRAPLLAPPPSRCARFHTHLPPASPSPQVPHQSMPRGRSTAAPPGAPSAAPRAGHPAVTRTEPRTVGDSSPGRGGRGAGNVTPTSPTASAPQRSAAPTAPPRRSPAAVRSPCSRSSPQGVGTWRGGLPSPTSPPSPWCLTRPHCCKDAQRCGGVGRGQLEPGGWGGEGVGLVSLGGLKQCHRDGEAEPPMGKAVQ